MVLLGVVELYLQTGKPIGSNTLRENGFDSLSSATIRNYFAKLEEEGFLKQQHSSGGRIPTPAAYRLYAETHLANPLLTQEQKEGIQQKLARETREVASYLQHAAEMISELTHCAVFLSAPRFDQDFILDMKLVSIDQHRLVCILVTDFGMIHTEVLYSDRKISSFAIKRMESYFLWRLNGTNKPVLDEEEEALASQFYKEMMLRHIVSHTHFSAEDLIQAGFSNLLSYPDFNDAAALASGLALFENKQSLRKLLSSCTEEKTLRCLVGEDLLPDSPNTSACSILMIPYRIHRSISGAFGILGPNRLPYRQLFGLMQGIADAISDSLTKSVYKYKLSFRQPTPSPLHFKQEGAPSVDQSHRLLLENKFKRTPS